MKASEIVTKIKDVLLSTAEKEGMIEAKEEAREEVPQELSADEAPAQAISHSPENEVTTKVGARFAVNANQNTTYGRVLKALSN